MATKRTTKENARRRNWMRQWRSQHPEESKAQQRVRYWANVEERRAQGRTEDARARQRASWRRRYYGDPAFRARKLLSYLLWQALKRQRAGGKAESTSRLVGCSMAELVAHIEAQFQPGMTWGLVHIDHIRPCASFDLKDPEQQRRCFHFSNLRPMWPEENQRKSSKWDGQHSDHLAGRTA